MRRADRTVAGALDGRELYRHAKTAGFVYQAALRAELTERLGVEWNEVENGTADLRGVSRAVIEHFSERRQEVVEHMRARGERSARAAQVATLETRRAKDYGVPADRLREEWRARAEEHGLDRWALRRVVERPVWRYPEPEEIVAQRLEGADGLTRERSTFCRRDVVQAFAEAARDGARARELEAAADRFLARAEIVALTAKASERRYTTRELLHVERELLDGAEQRRSVDAGRATPEDLDAALAARPTLSDEQRELVVALTRDGDGVLVVDEAGMVGTRDLARLADAARETDAKLVLVGDDRQLPEIDAGGAFAALCERVGVTELHEVRRQREAWDRDALSALRHGDTERFARDYHEHGRIVVSASADEAREALVEDWWQSSGCGEQALMIAHRRADVADLNERARRRMRASGRLGPDEVSTHQESAFAAGDRVVATRNDRCLGILNGQAGTLSEIRDDALTVDLDHGQRVELPRGYAEDGGLDHGYAITAHRAQGATVDRTFVLGSEGLYREWAYTALSRHRDEARYYVCATPAFLNRAPEPLRTEDDVAGAVTRMLDDSRAEHLASHGMAPDLRTEAVGEDLDRAQTELDDVEARLAELQEERDEVRWYQRSRRDELDTILAGHTRAQDHWRERVSELREQLAARPGPPKPPELWRATDPVSASDVGLELDLAAPSPDLAPDLDLDFDLGP